MRQDGTQHKAGQAAATAHSIRVEPLAGDEIAAALPALAQLRMRVFAAYPYLYEGSLAYEQRYLEKFAAADGAVIVAAWAGDTIVGAATASPMRFSQRKYPHQSQRRSRARQKTRPGMM